MKLWTTQPVEVYHILMRDGVFRADPDKIAHKYLLHAYDWLNEHLNNKATRPNGVSYPVWAWHTYANKHEMPPLEYGGHGLDGEEMVCLELDIPDELVLLSDFDAWHGVLNKWWLDDSLSEAEWEKNHDWYDNLPWADQERLAKESWVKIFNIEPFANEWMRRGHYVQAVFWELKKEYLVREPEFFIARDLDDEE